MLLWAMAALMNRRSRMVEVSAAVPTAAQAAWRMKSRRVRRMEGGFCSIRLSLDGEIGGVNEQVDHSPNAVAHLGVTNGRGVREVERVGQVVDNDSFGAAGELAADEEGIERVHQAGDAGVDGITAGHPGTDIQHDGSVAAGEAAQAVGVAGVVKNAAFEKIHLERDAGVGGQLE